MNIGQVLECHLGMIARLGFWVASPVFDGANEEIILKIRGGLSEDGK